MSEAEEEESSESETHENRCGVILGYWDHEKTPTLIQELEDSVGLIEEKCKALLEELIYYKKYLEETGELNRHFIRSKSKNDNLKLQRSCGSEPDIVLRKNFVNSQQTRQLFEEKFQQKLKCINRELTEVAEKIGLKNNIVLFPTTDYLKNLNSQIEKEADKSWCGVRENFIAGYFRKAPLKDVDQATGRGREAGFSKITKNELDLYLKLSRLSVNRKKRKVRKRQAASARGRKIKLGGRWKICKVRQDLRTGASEYGKPVSEKRKFKKRRNKVQLPRKGMRRSPRDFRSTDRSGAEGGAIPEPLSGRTEPCSSSGTLDLDPIAKQLPRFGKRKPGVRASASENFGGKTRSTVTSFGGATHREKL